MRTANCISTPSLRRVCTKMMTGDRLCLHYLAACESVIRRIHETQLAAIARAARHLADAVAVDRLIHVYGPGGHANLSAQEIFYRAGGLMHVSPILDPGTLLSEGALRSTAIERLPGYGRVVIDQANVQEGDVLLLINSFGVNAAVIDAAQTARQLGAFSIGFNSHKAAERIPADHPARHPEGVNLQDLVDIAIDTGIPDGDAALTLDGFDVPLGPVSTFANAYALNALMLHATALLVERGIKPPIWRSRNASAGDLNDAALIEAMRGRVRAL